MGSLRIIRQKLANSLFGPVNQAGHGFLGTLHLLGNFGHGTVVEFPKQDGLALRVRQLVNRG
jgi:hypothetical protein